MHVTEVSRIYASQETAAAMRSPYGALLYMRARHCHTADTVVMSVRETHFVVEDGVPQVLMRPVAVVCMHKADIGGVRIGADEAAHEPAQSGWTGAVVVKQHRRGRLAVSGGAGARKRQRPRMGLGG